MSCFVNSLHLQKAWSTDGPWDVPGPARARPRASQGQAKGQPGPGHGPAKGQAKDQSGPGQVIFMAMDLVVARMSILEELWM